MVLEHKKNVYLYRENVMGKCTSLDVDEHAHWPYNPLLKEVPEST